MVFSFQWIFETFSPALRSGGHPTHTIMKKACTPTAGEFSTPRSNRNSSGDAPARMTMVAWPSVRD
jgi:hypothetical protein